MRQLKSFVGYSAVALCVCISLVFQPFYIWFVAIAFSCFEWFHIQSPTLRFVLVATIGASMHITEHLVRKLKKKRQ